MSTNQGPEYFIAEKKFIDAKTDEEKIIWLEEMIRNFKKHKGSETMLSALKRRLSKLEEGIEKKKKVGKSSKKGIKKEGFQVVLLGLPNSGKSSLLTKLTNARPKISANMFSTTEPEIGALYHKGMKAQIVDLPAIGSPNYDSSIVHTANLVLIIIQSLSDIEKIQSSIARATGKKIFVLSKSDLLLEDQIRKLQETLRSKKIPGVIISSLTGFGIEELKDKIMSNTGMIRVYTKEPGKEKAPNPIMLLPNSTVEDVAEEIRNGFSKQVKEARITGPSSKFPNQKVGLSHKLKDLDIVEFHTR